MEIKGGGDKTYRGEWVRKPFSMGGLLVRFCPPLFPPPPLAFSELLAELFLRQGDWSTTVATEVKVTLIPPKYFVAFAFVLILIGTDDMSY